MNFIGGIYQNIRKTFQENDIPGLGGGVVRGGEGIGVGPVGVPASDY